MPTVRYEINKNILEWVLKTSEDTLNEKFVNNLKKWILSESKPTINQIHEISRASKVPFGYFFLNEPPKIDLPLLNFRTINNDDVDDPSKELLDTIYEMQTKVSWLRDYRIEQGFNKVAFVGMESKFEDSSIETKSVEILEYFDLPKDWNINQKDTFKYLREKITDYGITVNINSTVRNTRRHLNQNEFRAFLIVDEYAPLIFINSKDSFSARLFSLVHELVHLWYGKPELFNFNFQDNPQYNNAVSEREINLIVENIIFPKEKFLKIWNEVTEKNITDRIHKMAGIFGISTMATAIRAKNLNLVSQKIVNEIKEESENKYLEIQEKNRNGNGGPDFYTTLAYKVDNNFARDVIRSANSGETSYTKAFDLLNVKGTAGFNKLSDKIMGRIP